MNFHNAEKAYLVNSCDMYHLYPEYGMQKVNGTYRTNSIGRIFRYLPTQRWKPPLKSGRSDSSKVFTFPFSFKSQIWPFRFSFSRKSRHPCVYICVFDDIQNVNAIPVHTRSDFLNTPSDLRKSIHSWGNLNRYGQERRSHFDFHQKRKSINT